MDDHGEERCELHRALSGRDLRGRCRLPFNPASPSANAGRKVTMLVISMDVPLVLESTAIGCGLEVQT
ncbi:hypothetical protein BSZ19_49360 [Bradyrhizobium japonicum]|uniref:Uncharacterized protein n=1 Tax=Bradyrhizobium japonicum TaxID=375 RepID=A0A1Y2J9V4_BRAJP|nr:hypothetical protein BSZ19_49360 [Bradyrhizobium japonicum]